MAKKIYDDDDGRTVADMSGVQRQPLIIPRFKKKEKGEEESEKSDLGSLSKGDRRAVIGGTLSAALLVMGIFAAVIALVILLIVLIGH